MAKLGRYDILSELGRGGMGVVYRAFDPALQRLLAIKAIAAGGDPEYSRRLLAEARSAAQLRDPRIVTIFDVGQDGDTLYIVMELVEGRDLSVALGSGSAMLVSEFLRLMQQVAEALDYAHAQGVVHRDVKPSNIMVLPNGSAKIMDFGIAKRSASPNMTQVGTVLGTPMYMAPEQIKGQPVDGRSDQFSLAVVAYEGLTGRSPFQHDNVPTVFLNIVNSNYERPSTLNPELGPDVDMVLRKALSVNADERYPTCEEFAKALTGAIAETRHLELPTRKSASESLASKTVQVADIPPGSTVRICTQCGSENRPDAADCIRCGARMLGGPEPSTRFGPFASAPPPPPAPAPVQAGPPPMPYEAYSPQGRATLPNVTALASAAPTRFLEDLPRTGFFSGEQMRFSKIEESFRFFRDNLQKQYESLTRQADVVWKLWAVCVGVGFLVLIAGLTAMFFSNGQGTITKGTVTGAGTVLVYYIQRLFQHREDVYRRAAEEKNSHLEYGNKWLLVIQTVDAIQDTGERKRQQARIAEALTHQLENVERKSPRTKSTRKTSTAKSKRLKMGA